MVDKRRIDIPIVTRFVREVLGCNCPDEIFRRVEVQTGSTAIKSCPADYEIRIGGRLLVVVTSDPVERLSAFCLENAAHEKERLLRSFEEISPWDERTHLHVVEKREVPHFFLGTQPSS